MESLPPWKHSPKHGLSWHSPQASINNEWLCIGLKYTTETNKTYKYHVSLQICKNRCFACRNISPLKIYYLYQFSREERHTFLRGLLTFSIKLTLITRLILQNRTEFANTFIEGSDMINNNFVQVDEK
jgi:hypothetical protein